MRLVLGSHKERESAGSGMEKERERGEGNRLKDGKKFFLPIKKLSNHYNTWLSI